MANSLNKNLNSKVAGLFAAFALSFLAIPGFAQAISVSLLIEGSTNYTLPDATSSFTVSLSTVDATSCEQTSPVASGIALNTSMTVSPGLPDYPAPGSTVTFSVTCIDTDSTAESASASVTLPTPTVPPTGGGGVSVDVQVDGSNGPVTISNGQNYTYTWVSANATACSMTSPVASGISTSGSTTVDQTIPGFYPAVGSPITITIECTNGTDTVSDSVVVDMASVPTPPTSGGGGGGGGGGSSRSNLSFTCPWLLEYMRIDLPNNPIEVMKLQSFLKVFMGYDYVEINGVFDQATYNAVGAFQAQYSDEILAPWGHTEPTHYVYLLTLKKINEIYCGDLYPLTPGQVDEVESFRALLEAARAAQVPVSFTPGAEVPSEVGTTTPIELPVVGFVEPQGQNLSGLVAAIFALPANIKDILWTLYEFVIILLVLYTAGTLFKDIFYKDEPENELKRFSLKWGFVAAGILAAILGVILLGSFNLVLPLILAFSAVVFWVLRVLKGGSIKASIKSWVIVIRARAKSLLSRFSTKK